MCLCDTHNMITETQHQSNIGNNIVTLISNDEPVYFESKPPICGISHRETWREIDGSNIPARFLDIASHNILLTNNRRVPQ